MNVMKKIILTTGFLLSSVAFSADKAPEGSTLVPNPQSQYFSQDGKVTVQQFLWHECIHCYKLDPFVDQWDKINADYITFERVPVAWGDKHVKDGSFYNYAKVLRKTEKINDQDLVDINNELFKIGVIERKGLTAKTVFPIFEKYGVKSVEELETLIGSFVTSSEINKAKKLTNAYEIQGVPVFVVAGKYLVSFQSLKEATPAELFATLDRIADEEHKSSMTSSTSKDEKEVSTTVEK